VKATLFVVGADLERERVRNVLREALARGHAVANHSQDHPADFGACEPDARARQVALAHESIRATLGVSPVGFRGPGYVFDSVVRETLRERGYRYDSSYYPGWTPALMQLAMRAKGARKPLGGDRVELPRWDGGAPSGQGLVEVPILTVTRLRLPAHTTALFAFGARYTSVISRLLRSRPAHGVFLLHAVDGLDSATAPRLGMLPTLKRPLGARLSAIGDVLEAAARHGEIRTTESALAR
jgi:peptidoglycan/xylan/chitin deacetylase (PgdA/CDA1 family)